jgi:hypothetical protein
MECYVLASDFKRDKYCTAYSTFHDEEVTPLAIALRRLTGKKDVETFVEYSLIEGIRYNHKPFSFGDYKMYYLRAEKIGFTKTELVYFNLVLAETE